MAAKRIPRGKHLTKTASYKIETRAGKKRRFTGTLLKTFYVGKARLAVFRIRKSSQSDP